jgi:hypothetical protein
MQIGEIQKHASNEIQERWTLDTKCRLISWVHTKKLRMWTRHGVALFIINN